MAVDMVMKIDDLPGESKISGKEGWIDVLAWSWGASNSANAHYGGGSGAGKVNVQDLSLTKYVDMTSCSLLLKCCDGTHFEKATLIVRKAGTNALEYVTVEMEQVFITSVSTGGSGGEDRLTENVTLNFAKVKVQYKGQSATGAEEGGNDMTWDIAGNVQ
jgi:type VI secretion system secreted protein Hcp